MLDFLFSKGNNDERRLLCETIFRRVTVRNGKIVHADLNSPFTLIASRAEGSGTLTDWAAICRGGGNGRHAILRGW